MLNRSNGTAADAVERLPHSGAKKNCISE